MIVNFCFFWFFYCVSSYINSFLIVNDNRKIKNINNVIFVISKNILLSLLITIIYIFCAPIFYLGEPHILLQFIMLPLSNELWFDLAHRLFHTKQLFKFHALHHSYNKPNAWIAVYCSSVEMIFCNILSMNWTELFFKYNPNLLSMWYIISAINTTTISHGGLKDSSIGKIRLLKYLSFYHDKHHENPKYNFGTLHLIDRILGTFKE